MSERRKEPIRHSASVLIRPFQPDDAQEWRRLRHALWPETTERDHSADLAEYLRSPETHVILVAALFQGGLAGIAEIRIRSHADDCYTSPVGYLEGWIVAPEHRRCGIGRGLIEAAETWSRAHGCREFASDTHIENSSSRAAHRALGFQEGPAVVWFSKTLGSPLPDDRGS
jgi:aminoglycoside 6'-N-acetyltransferase I